MAARDNKAEIQALIQAGKPAVALTRLQVVLKRVPRDADLWLLQGIAQAMQSELPGAEKAFSRAVELAPTASAAWEHLARVQMLQGKLVEAERSFRKSMTLNPRAPMPYVGLGEIKRNAGDLSGSEELLRTAIRLAPQQATVHNQLGATLSLAGKREEAIKCYRAALGLTPDFLDARANLASTLRADGQLEEAIVQLQAYVSASPQHLPARYELAAALLDLNRWMESLEVYRQILAINSQAYMAHVCMGKILMTQADLNAAKIHLDTARAMRPEDDPDVSAPRAELAMLEGDRQYARELITPALKTYPDSLNLSLVEARLLARSESPQRLLGKLEHSRQQLQHPPEALFLELGRLYERVGRYDEAFDAYKSTHANRRAASDLSQHLDEMDRLEAFFTRQRLAQLPSTGNDARLPVFIVGMPRSGTTLAEQILASHPGVFGAGETTRLWQLKSAIEAQTGLAYPAALESIQTAALRDVASDYLQQLQMLAPDAIRICDKLPHNFLHLGLIQMLFPGATIIHCRRDPRDTCLSIYTHRFNNNHRYAQYLDDLGRYYRRYEQLMTHWKGELDLNIHTLDYERLIADQAGESHRLIEVAGLDWDDSCLRFFETTRAVVTPSADQVREPLYTSSVGRWRHFEAHLEPLCKALG